MLGIHKYPNTFLTPPGSNGFPTFLVVARCRKGGKGMFLLVLKGYTIPNGGRKTRFIRVSMNSQDLLPGDPTRDRGPAELHCGIPFSNRIWSEQPEEFLNIRGEIINPTV